MVQGIIPKDAHEENRVKRTAPYYLVDGQKHIWVRGHREKWLRVPWIKDRPGLIKEIHQEAGLCGGEQLAALVKTRYFWSGVRAACLQEAEECVAR